MKRTTLILVTLLVLVSMILSACGATPTATPVPVPPTATPVPVPPTATKAPVVVPTNTTAPVVVAPTNTTAPVVAAPTNTAVPPTATKPAPTNTPAPAGPTNTPAPTATPIPGQAGVVTIWHGYSGEYLTAINAVIADYTKANPNVKIQFANVANLNDALKAAVPTKKGPDILAWANDQIGANALNGNIVDLAKYGVDQAFLKSVYEPAGIAGVTWQGKIWGLPETEEGIALIYNKDLVTDKYLPTNPLNFDDLLAKATAFATDNPGKTLICNQGLGGNDPYHAAPVYFGFGVPSYVDDAGKVYMNTPEAIKAAQWMVSLSKVSLKETSYDICKTNLIDKKVGMWWTGPWALADLEKAGIKYGILPMGKPFVGIKTWMLTSNAVDRGNADAAVALMKYFTSADVQKKLALVNKTIPAATAALKDPSVQALYSIVAYGAALNLGVPMANTPFADAQWAPVGDATLAVWTGKQTPADAMKGAQDAMDAKIKQMK
jgi:arabinogalactan oligomer / maltooligosaccharide transport system substrate-binding protein